MTQLNTKRPDIEIVEVSPRDGFQAIEPFIPTAQKIALIEQLIAAGLRRIEIGSFVSPSALPQMRDVGEVLAAVSRFPHVQAAVLVPNLKGAESAQRARASNLVYVISASESHNQRNVRRNIQQSLEELGPVLRCWDSDERGIFRLNLSTCFDCPFEGRIPDSAVFRLVDAALALRDDIEIGICDTTGKALPGEVRDLFAGLHRRYGEAARFAFHAHDTYGFGIANVWAALESDVRIIDAAIAGLGGCPFAPGATGNIASEDVAYFGERLGYSTGLDLETLLQAATSAGRIDGALAGGHIRMIASSNPSAVAARA
jgi:hydroxymethylglutaryl-CoA lyase